MIGKQGRMKKTKKQTHNDGRASEEKLIFLSKKTNSKEIIDNIFFFLYFLQKDEATKRDFSQNFAQTIM